MKRIVIAFWRMRNILYIILAGFFLMQACERLTSRPDEFADYDSTQYERLSINYEILGDRDTCLVFIHGWNLDLRYWDEQVKQFGNRYRILTLDPAVLPSETARRHSTNRAHSPAVYIY